MATCSPPPENPSLPIEDMPMTHDFHPTMLREYDIRGIVGDTLTEADAHAIGRSFAKLIRRAGSRRVAVGYDGRLSSPLLEAALVAALNAAGIDALRVGMGPPPLLYYAASTPKVDGGIQITRRPHPTDYNPYTQVLQGRSGQRLVW